MHSRANPVPSGPSNTTHTPLEEYSSLAEVDPSVFADAGQAEAVARAAFANWVRQSPMAPENPDALVRDVKLEKMYWGRLESEIASRMMVWHEEAYTGSQQVSASPLPEGTADPWSTSAEELRLVSQHICRCDTCKGTGKVSCPECGGKARVQCSNCQGTGKAYGYAKNGSRRLMNCRVCSGQLELQCSSCAAGMRACAICGGSGRKERWRELVETKRAELRGGPAEHLSHALFWKNAVADASRDEICADAIVVGQADASGVLGEAKVAHLAPGAEIVKLWKDLQPTLRTDERIVLQSFTVFEVPRVTLRYSLPGAGPRTVRFEGLRLLAPPISRDEIFGVRARWLRLTRNVLLVTSLGVPLVYLARGEYFRKGSVAAAELAFCAVAFAVYRLIRSLMLYSFAHSRIWAWIAGSGAILLCGLMLWVEPSAGAARRLLSNDQLDAARQELLALGDPGRPEQAKLWASLHLAIAKKTTDPEIIRRELSEIPPRTPQRKACASRLREVAESTVREQLAAKQSQHAEALLASVTPVLADELRGDPSLVQISELRALDQEQMFDACSSDVCRLNAARKALSYAASPAREQRLNASRRSVLASLSYQPSGDDPVLARLTRLRSIQALARELTGQEGDNELTAEARAATETAQRARVRVSLIGADAAILGELLGPGIDQGGSILRFEDNAVSLFASMRSGRCVGAYIVGSSKEQRTLDDSAHSKTTIRLLSQSLGREMALPEQPRDPSGRGVSISRLRIGSMPLVARWNGTALSELRIGEAQP